LKNFVVVRRAIWLCFLAGLAGVAGAQTQQHQRRVIQLSGVILATDSATAVPGVHVWVPKAMRGTVSNRVGFFSLPVIPGDSVVFSAVGFVRQHYIVPQQAADFLTLIVEMVEDVTFLREVTITPFPTEEVFKQAVLAMNLPLHNTPYDRRNLNAELLALMMQTTPMDGNLNYRYYIDQYASTVNDQFQPRVMPFLNPFNWARFFRDMKQNRKK
jgi:hypothetical protein